jgi:hypothetical protein
MERTMWTDERLNDLANKVDSGFERLDRDIRDLRQLMFQLWGATMVTQLIVIVAIVITNG